MVRRSSLGLRVMRDFKVWGRRAGSTDGGGRFMQRHIRGVRPFSSWPFTNSSSSLVPSMEGVDLTTVAIQWRTLRECD